MAATIAKPTRTILDSILSMPADAQATVVPAFALTHKLSEADFYDLLAEREDEKASEALVAGLACNVEIPENVSEILMSDPTKRLVFTFKRDTVETTHKVDGKDIVTKRNVLVQVASIQTARGRKAKGK